MGWRVGEGWEGGGGDGGVEEGCKAEGGGSAAAGERGVEQWREEGGRGDIRWGVG